MMQLPESITPQSQVHKSHEIPDKPRVNVVLPMIQTKYRHLREISKDALDTMAIANRPPKWFVRGGVLARITADEKSYPSIERMGADVLRGILARSANFVSGPKQTPCPPPMNVVRDILTLGKWSFPSLEGIVESPVMRSDGTILSRHGYDLKTKLYLHPSPNLRIETIPEHPTQAEIELALKLLKTVLADFPFVDNASRTNMLALLMTPILRFAIEGNIPLALIDAPQSGTGKTLLSKIVAILASGVVTNLTTAPKTEEEWNKKITSILFKGSLVVILDNLSWRFETNALSAVLTTDYWTDRILGRSEMIGLPHYSIWVANGNNVQLGGDLPRRCYPIRLDSSLSRPWERKNFKIRFLEKWVTENRGSLIRAILILARGWINAGSPGWTGQIMGGFTSWTTMLGGILNYVEEGDFLGNNQRMYEITDEEGRQWETFLLALHDHFCEQKVTSRAICEAVIIDQSLSDLLPDSFNNLFDRSGNISPSLTRQLGMEFSKRLDTRYGTSQVRIMEAPKDINKNVAQWMIIHRECGSCGS